MEVVIVVIVIVAVLVLYFMYQNKQAKKAFDDGYQAGKQDGVDNMPMPQDTQILREGRFTDSKPKFQESFLNGYQSGYRDGHRNRN